MTTPHDLKAMQVQATKLGREIQKAQSERHDLLERAATLRAVISDLRTELNALNASIASLTTSTPIVSEHAMLRYIERVYGVSLAEVADAILTPQNRNLIKFAGNCKIKAADMTFIVREGCVVSVVT